MTQYHEAYLKALRNKRKGNLWRDVFILTLIALFFIIVGFGIIWWLSRNIEKIDTKISTGISNQPTAVVDRETIPVDVAELMGGQYLKSKKVPVLMYHYVREMPGDDDPLGQTLSVTPEEFDNQMAYLQEQGFESITLDDFYGGQVPDNPIIITFDDGYKDAYEKAYPILQKYGMKGTFYIVVNFVDEDLYLTWDQIKEMQAGGMAFGSHTMNHANMASKTMTDTRKMYELIQSKKILEQELGTTVNNFCYPGGQATTKTVDQVYDAEYKTATSTRMGVAQKGIYWLWTPRLRIKNDSNIGYLIQKYS